MHQKRMHCMQASISHQLFDVCPSVCVCAFIRADVLESFNFYLFDLKHIYVCRKRKLQEVAKHEKLPKHPNCVEFIRAWEEKQHLYIQTELCKTRSVFPRQFKIIHILPQPIVHSTFEIFENFDLNFSKIFCYHDCDASFSSVSTLK